MEDYYFYALWASFPYFCGEHFLHDKSVRIYK